MSERMLTPEEVEDDARSFGPESGSFDLSWWRYIITLRAAWAERDEATAACQALAPLAETFADKLDAMRDERDAALAELATLRAECARLAEVLARQEGHARLRADDSARVDAHTAQIEAEVEDANTRAERLADLLDKALSDVERLAALVKRHREDCNP